MRKNERQPQDCCTMGSSRPCSGDWRCRKHCSVVKQIRHHISSLGFCLLPGKRTSPNPSKPHALHVPPNTISTSTVKTPFPLHGPPSLPPLLGGWCPGRCESTENGSVSGASPAPQSVLSPAPGNLRARTMDLYAI